MIIRKGHKEKGQALLETTLFMPLFLLGFYGIFWAIRAGTLSERLQYGVRYAGTISSQTDTYKRLSIESLYSEVDGITRLGPQACATSDPAVLTQNRPVFFQPLSIAQNQCHGQSTIVTGPESYSMAFFTENDFIKMSANMPANGYLSSIGFSNNAASLSASQNYFKPPGITTSYLCGAAKNDSKASLEGFYDTRASSATQSLLLPITPIAGSPYATDCSPVSPAPTLLPVDTPVPAGNTFTIPPTPKPSVTTVGTAAPTPVPTATPAPTPTPVPTPIPTPTGSPGNFS